MAIGCMTSATRSAGRSMALLGSSISFSRASIVNSAARIARGMKSRMPGNHGRRLALAAALVYAVGCATSQPDFDLVFTGGSLIDGTGAEPRRADVGIKGDRI